LTGKPPPSKEVEQEDHVRTIKHKFKTEVAEMLGSQLFEGMGKHLEENHEILNYIDMIDCSVSVISSLIKQQIAIAKQSDAPEIYHHVIATWSEKLLSVLESIEQEKHVTEE